MPPALEVKMKILALGTQQRFKFDALDAVKKAVEWICLWFETWNSRAERISP